MVNVEKSVFYDLQVWIPVISIFFAFQYLQKEIFRYPLSLVMSMFLMATFCGVITVFVTGLWEEYFAFLRIAKGMLMFLGGGAFVALYKKKYGARWDALLWMIYLGIFVHGCILSAQVLIPGLREWMEQYLFLGFDIERQGHLAYSRDYRMPGLTQEGGSFASMLQGIGLGLLPFMIRGERNILKYIILIVASLVNFSAIVFTGKSGFYMVLLLSLVAFVLAWQIPILRKRESFIQYLFSWGVGVTVAALLVLPIFAVTASLDEKTEKAINRNLGFVFRADTPTEGIIELAEGYLSDLIVFPESVEGWLIGDPRIATLKVYITDIGYCRMLLGYGLPGTIMQTSIYAILLMFLFRRRRHLDRIGFAAIFLLLFNVLYNYKEFSFFARIEWPMASIVFFAALESLRERERLFSPVRRPAYGMRHPDARFF
jgi:O-antigen ligase